MIEFPEGIILDNKRTLEIGDLLIILHEDSPNHSYVYYIHKILIDGTLLWLMVTGGGSNRYTTIQYNNRQISYPLKFFNLQLRLKKFIIQKCKNDS